MTRPRSGDAIAYEQCHTYGKAFEVSIADLVLRARRRRAGRAAKL